MHRSLRTFLDLLVRENEIVTIHAEVDPCLELAEIHRRVIESGGPALLFKRVKGSRYPVVTNLFGTERRISLSFGPKPERLVRELVHVAESLLPLRPAELWQHRQLALEFLKLGTRNTGRAPVTQVVDRPARLDQLPVLTTWQEDGGPFITLPLVYTENPTTGKHNPVSIGCRFTIHVLRAALADSKRRWISLPGSRKAGQRLPVTVLLGGPPALILAAIAPCRRTFRNSYWPPCWRVKRSE
jgi:UbiD family decarboxylase